MITNDPPPRVAAILQPLEQLADEVVIGADSRLDEDTLAGYGALADRLFLLEFVQVERHLAWLCAQCGGDWILRLDGDEVLSQALLARLPAMLESRRVQQYWIARDWLYPDGGHVLASTPWSEDFVNRLTRNDGTLRISGQVHSDPEPVTPREFVEQPIYHLDLLTSDRQQRLDKTIRYEAFRGGLRAAGGGRINEAFYLPELHRELPQRGVPDEDREAIARVLRGVPPPPAEQPRAARRFVSLAEMDRRWEGRTVPPEAYSAAIVARSASLAMTPGERRHVMLSVRNDGCERWPAHLEEHPQIRLSYRWLDGDGSIHVSEGPRTPFPRPVEPGEGLLAPLDVVAPTAPGQYVLEVDVVHEDVRWFGCARRVPARVGEPGDLPAAGPRLTATDPPRLRRLRALRVPRTFHRVWLGGGPIPPEHERFAATFAELHPSWEMRLWTDEDLPSLDIGAMERERARSHSELSNLVRYEVLCRHGGVYVDTDVECRRSLAGLLRGADAFAALETPGRVGTAVIGSIPGHRVFARAARLARQTLGTGVHSPDANGPGLLTLVIEQEDAPRFAIFAARLFYPYLWDEPERRHETFPDAYAVHHWTLSWVP